MTRSDRWDRSPDRSRSPPLSPPPAGPWKYTPRPESENALARIVALLRAGATRVVLEGPPASGKTLLLHVLPARLGPAFASAYLPHPGLGPDEVRAWLVSFGESLPADAGVTFEDLVFAHARRGPGLVLLIDDANAMPEAVAREFAALLARTGAALRIVVAGVGNASFDAVVGALGEPEERVRIGAPRPQAARPDAWATPLVRSPQPVVEAAPAQRLAAPPTPDAAAPLPLAATPLSPAPASMPPAPAAASMPPTPAAAPLRPTPAPPPPAPAPMARVASDAAPPPPPAGRAAAAPSPPSRSSLLTPQRAAALAAIAFAAAAALVLLRPGARDELPDVAAAASATQPSATQPEPSQPEPTQLEPTPPEPTPQAVESGTVAGSEPAPSPVPVHLNARPWARIFVDERELGVTPLGNVPVEPGLRHFRAELSDGRTVEREVRIESANQRVTFP